MRMDTSGVNRWVDPSRWDVNVTPSSSTRASRSLPSAMMSSAWTRSVSIASTLRKPAPRDSTWKPPLSVNVGPCQFMNAPSPPASSTTSAPGCRYRWYALARTACAPSSFMVSGRTPFTVALVPTAMKAGVRMSPCGVRMTPARPNRPGSSASTVKNGSATTCIQSIAKSRQRSPSGKSRQSPRGKEPHNLVGEFLSGILLQEMPGGVHDRMIDAMGATHLAGENGGHGAGDVIAVAECHQHRCRTFRQCLPGRPIGRPRRVIGGCRYQARHGARAGAVGVVRERSVVSRAHGVRHRPPAARLDEPADLNCRHPLDGAAEAPPDLGHGQIAAGQAGVGYHDAREAVRMFGGQSPPDEPAPVLADQRHPPQVQDVERQRAHPLDVAGVAVVLAPGGLVRSAEADEVRADHPMAGGNQYRDHAP